MIDQTLHNLESRIQASTLDPEARATLEDLVAQLKSEINKLDDEEQAESIAAHTDSGAREALRTQPDEDMMSHALEGMRKSVRHFEATYPDLTGVVNTICQQLSNLGI